MDRKTYLLEKQAKRLAGSPDSSQPLKPSKTTIIKSLPCIHEGNILERCHTCNSESKHVRECDIYQRCTRGVVSSKVQSCTGCSEYKPDATTMDANTQRRIALASKGIGRGNPVTNLTSQNVQTSEGNGNHPKVKRKQPLKYAYGITTIPARRDDLFRRTLQSLKDAGFDTPRLFVDGDSDTESWRREFGLEVTSHYPKIRTYGNWILGLGELYIRDPWADRFCIFQDDFVTYKNLKRYLDEYEMPEKGYWNLYTFPKNQVRIPETHKGWWVSNQKGLGALALIFSRDAVTTLLHSLHMIERPKDVFRGWRAVDGGIVTSMNKAGYKEYVHSISLVQHLGIISSMGTPTMPLATSFRGENFDATKLIEEFING